MKGQLSESDGSSSSDDEGSEGGSDDEDDDMQDGESPKEEAQGGLSFALCCECNMQKESGPRKELVFSCKCC